MSAATAVTSRVSSGDLLRIADLSAGELKHLLALAGRMKRDPGPWLGSFTGQALGLCLDKPSTRTRISFVGAAIGLGLTPVALEPDDLHGAPLAAIVASAPAQRDVEAIADEATVPVINALTGEHDLCQAIADVMTVSERFGELMGLKLAITGGRENLAHSLMEIGALLGMEVAVVDSAALRLDHEITLQAEIAARTHGGSIDVTEDLERAARGADVVYGERATERLLSLAADDAIYMHPYGAVNRTPTAQAMLYERISKGVRP